MHFGSLFDDGNTKEEQGEYGEFRVKNKILRNKEQLGCSYLYNDVYLEKDNNVYQIDHILLTVEGIFVIETKAISGKIYGSIDKEMWHSNVYGKSTRFLNPIIQNEIHIKALKNEFGDDFPYHSIIVFTERNKPNNLPDNVLNIKELKDYLLSFKSNKKLSPVEMNYFKVNLDEIITYRTKLKAKHKQQLKYKSYL